MSLSAKTPAATKWVRLWLLVLGLLVYAMILVGGATRLTDSGLSITEWDPISGTLPPLSAAEWQVLFDKYKTTAEYQFQNAGMSLAEFRYIFWWEWAHRFLGRFVGLVAVGGFAFFLWRKWLSPALTLRCLFLIALGGLQGFIGWWMVSSGIGETTRVDVAPYRLAMHFGLALFIIAVTAWTWMQLGSYERRPSEQRPRLAATVLLALISLQMLTGALVAGLDAGRTYTDWPLMAGEFLPGNYIGSLGIRALFEGVAATQFNHRILAYIILAGAIFSVFVFRRHAETSAFALVATLVTLQSAWGILTLVNAAPLNLALVHQGLGVIVLLAAVRLRWRLQLAS